MRLRTRLASCLYTVSFLAALPCDTSAQAATGSVTVTAHFATRTSLSVSSQHLVFNVPEGGEQATASVDVEARARTHTSGEVVLLVEPLRTPDGPGGAADVETAIAFAGEGEGMLAGRLQPASSTVAGRWRGSGRHAGRLQFALHTGTPGVYRLPLQFLLTAP